MSDSEMSDSNSNQPEFASGFVSILGRPSAGKSTLLNALVGTKLAIVAEQPQTTRTSVQGVWTTANSQVVFLDTPGIHRSDTMFNRRMMMAVRSALDARDLLLYVVDATLRLEVEDSQALDMVRKAETPTFLVLNKIDRVKEKAQLLPLIEKYKTALEFDEYIPVSALKGQGLDELRAAILKRIPENADENFGDHLRGTRRAEGDYYRCQGGDAEAHRDDGPARDRDFAGPEGVPGIEREGTIELERQSRVLE